MRYILPISYAVFALQICLATEVYVPNDHVDLEEPWRWTELENLEDLEFHCADQDEKGVIWFGKKDGLTAYNGIEFIDYPFPFDDREARNTKNVFAASDGTIYLLTTRVLAALQANREWRHIMDVDESPSRIPLIAESSDGANWAVLESSLYRIGPQGISMVSGQRRFHNRIAIDGQDRIWLRELNKGELLVFSNDLKQGSLGKPVARIPIEEKLSKGSTALFKAKDGGIWSVSPRATPVIRKFDLSFESVSIPDPPLSRRRTGLTFSVMENGLILLLWDRDLLYFQGGKWTRLDRSNYPLPSRSPFFLELSDNRFFFGGRVERGFFIDASNHRWQTLRDLNYQCDDKTGRSWFIESDKRIVSHNPATGQWIAYNTSDGIIDSPNRILCGGDGTLWVSGGHDGIAAVSRLESETWIRETFPIVGYTFSFLGVCETSSGNVVFGNGSEETTLDQHKGGLVVYRKSEGEYIATHIPPPLYPNRPATIVERQGDGLWLGGYVLSNSNPANGLSAKSLKYSSWIDHVAVDPLNNLWVAKWGDGLYRHDGNDWTLFRTADGLASNQTVFVLPGNKLSGLWVATRSGLSRYDGQSWTKTALSDKFEFFREGATLAESSKGELWINHGPRSWLMNLDYERPYEPKSLIRAIRYRPDNTPPETILAPSEKTLHEPASALFSWTGKDLWNDTLSGKLEYSYRLSDSDWSPFQRDTHTSIHDLPSGEYTFEVRARDRDWNIDPSPATISFEIIPPLWKRPWFIATTVIAITAIIGLIILVIQMRMKHIIALEEFKIDFFTNLSHELRTPLSVILGPLENIASRMRQKADKETLSMVLRNARKMLGLVNQLLEFRKVELGKLKYHPIQGEVIEFIKDSVYSLGPLWENKCQTLEISANVKAYRCGFDPDKLQRIIDNLVSNAIKYTPENGEIRIHTRIKSSQGGKARLHLSISDNGIGIPKEKLVQVTAPFCRAQSNLSEHESSGIGLALVKGLVDLWGGELRLESETAGPKRGTRVTLRLPLGRLDETAIPVAGSHEETETEEQSFEESESKSVSKPHILLVEDNPDVLKFLHDELIPHFAVSTASDGLQGLDSIQKDPPDLVVTDVMMPELDGIDFCRSIRENRETCHLPIIILTARAAERHYIEGIETGADEYFSKPIKASLLIARIHNLLRSRQQLRNLFVQQVVIEPKDIAVVSTDQMLLQKAVSTLEENMQTEGYDVEAFAKDLALSRITLYRKLKGLTGLSIADFIRSIRLKRAAQLLQATDLTIGEILSEVGYYDASSFSRSFKKKFGQTPTQYREERRQVASLASRP